MVRPRCLHTGTSYLHFGLGKSQADSKYHGRFGGCDAGSRISRSDRDSISEQQPTLLFRISRPTRPDIICRGPFLRRHEPRAAQGLPGLGYLYCRSTGACVHQRGRIRTVGCILVPSHTQHQEGRRWPSSATNISRTIHVIRYGASFARNEVSFTRDRRLILDATAPTSSPTAIIWGLSTGNHTSEHKQSFQ